MIAYYIESKQNIIIIPIFILIEHKLIMNSFLLYLNFYLSFFKSKEYNINITL